MAIDINPILSLLADNRKIILLNGKQPVTKDWPTKDVSLEEIKNHIKNGGNVGYRLDGLLVIDVERRPNKTDKTRIVRAMRKLGWEESKSAMRFSDGDKARAFRRVA